VGRSMSAPVDAPKAMACCHNLSVAAQDGVQAPKPGDLLAGPGIALEPPARRLVEKDGYRAVVVVDLAAVGEQAIKGRRRDAALLHAGASVPTETVEGIGSHLVPPAGAGNAPTLPRSMRRSVAQGMSQRATCCAPSRPEGPR